MGRVTGALPSSSPAELYTHMDANKQTLFHSCCQIDMFEERQTTTVGTKVTMNTGLTIVQQTSNLSCYPFFLSHTSPSSFML